MALLRQPLAQLPDSDGEHAVLLQRPVELAEFRRELVALVGDFLALGRRILLGRGTELLEPLLELAHARLELLDLAPDGVGRGGQRAAMLRQRLGRDVVAADRRLDLVERSFQLLERRGFGGLFLPPRLAGQPCACGEDDGQQAPKHELPPDRRPNSA